MRYGFAINGGRMMLADRKEIKSMVIGALLAAGFNETHSVQEEASKVLRQADVLAGQQHQVDLEDVGELQVWLDRGADVKDRAYLVQVGKGVSFRTGDTTLLINFIAGLMVSDGVGLEKATALGENVAYALSEGGGYPYRVVTELRDRREVRAWFEDGTEGAL